jgi:hypothetical protein
MFIENKWSELQIMPRYVNSAEGDLGKRIAILFIIFPVSEVKGK